MVRNRSAVVAFVVLTCLLLTGANHNSIWGDAVTDQQRCQKEADYMVKHRQFRHVGPCIGSFEGIGYGGSHPKIGTCTPKYKMILTGDASAQCASGTWVRVRSWRRRAELSPEHRER
tara:strand:+ start:3299 stop:3649 length:351 start_codon:yes stop_codon:yes gene_type:complete